MCRGTSEHPRTLTSLAREWAPHLRVVSVSNPEPHLERLNVVATTADQAIARTAVLELEAEEIDDARIGLVVLGPPSDESDTQGVDPEGVGRAILPRVLLGGVLGALVGAGAGAIIAAIGGARPAFIAAAALAGAAIVGVIGAIWATFPRLGGSDAYRQTFVDDELDELNIVSLHTRDPSEAERAIDRLSSHPELAVRLLDADGATVPRREAGGRT